MSKTRRKRYETQMEKPSKKRFPIFVSIFLLLFAGFTIIVTLSLCFKEAATPVKPILQRSLSSLKKFQRKVVKFSDLIIIQPKQLADADIAEMNLLCAEDLPGAEKFDIDRCLAKLDEWALKVRFETNRHLYRVKDPRFANHYHHSESYYRAEMLLQVLQEDCGVKYNPERIRDVDFTNSKDLFIHGMIDDTNGGTCASMPVLYVAVGRRLDYPMYLVRAKGHLFARWDNGKERFNIEGAGEGFTSYPDSHYETWPIL